jgi:hypothetical protein
VCFGTGVSVLGTMCEVGIRMLLLHIIRDEKRIEVKAG